MVLSQTQALTQIQNEKHIESNIRNSQAHNATAYLLYTYNPTVYRLLTYNLTYS